MNMVEQYADLKTRVSDLSGSKMLWDSRREVLEATKAKLLVDLAAMGINTEDLEAAKVEVTSRLEKGLETLSAEVVKAEAEFSTLRSKYEQKG